MPAISPARKAAFKILLAVERGSAHADELLRDPRVDALSAADRNLATALVLGVLRWQIRLDEQIRPLLKHPNAKLDAEVQIALRMGAFQLMHLDRVPAHAAIDESVELVKRAGHRFASGMVNAVLRKLASAGEVERQHSAGAKAHTDLEAFSARLELPQRRRPVAGDPGKSCPVTKQIHLGSVSSDGGSTDEGRIFPGLAEEVALAYAHPVWMVERWAEFYGAEAALAICAHGQRQPALCVRVANAEIEDELTRAGIELEAGELLTAARTVTAGDVTSSAAVREGRVRVQDEGSQLVGELAAFSSGAKTILDACAAPGGKTLILAERNPEARIVACEASEHRLAALRERVVVYERRVECRLTDAMALEVESAFDLVLADVPCSGTGTLGRNPEIRHRLRMEDLARHAERQRRILSAALRAVRPGGFVFYSTCSLEPEENEQVVAAVLAEMPKARQVSLGARIERLRGAGVLTVDGAEQLGESLTAEGALRLVPGVFETDGFFVAGIEKLS